jgi:hypothetical protein
LALEQLPVSRRRGMVDPVPHPYAPLLEAGLVFVQDRVASDGTAHRYLALTDQGMELLRGRGARRN